MPKKTPKEREKKKRANKKEEGEIKRRLAEGPVKITPLKPESVSFQTIKNTFRALKQALASETRNYGDIIAYVLVLSSASREYWNTTLQDSFDKGKTIHTRYWTSPKSAAPGTSPLPAAGTPPASASPGTTPTPAKALAKTPTALGTSVRASSTGQVKTKEGKYKSPLLDALKGSISSPKELRYLKKGKEFEAKEASEVRVAAITGGEEAIKKLLEEQGINVALRIAVLSGKPEFLETLLSREDVDVNAVDSIGFSALHMLAACKGENYNSILQQFLTKGANINIGAGTAHGTPLHFAAELGNLNRVKELIRKGADINAVTSLNISILSTAVLEGRTAIVQELLANNANVNDVNDVGDSALHMAASLGNNEIAKMLIEKGATINARNEEGETPLQVAVTQGKWQFANWLIKQEGINLDPEGPNGPAHKALQKELKESLQQALKAHEIELKSREIKIEEDRPATFLIASDRKPIDIEMQIKNLQQQLLREKNQTTRANLEGQIKRLKKTKEKSDSKIKSEAEDRTRPKI